MAPQEGVTTISLAEAEAFGVPALVREAEAGREQIIERDGQPVAVVIGVERYERLQQLRDDSIDITLAENRTRTGSGQRHALDDALAHFGFARAELAAQSAPIPVPDEAATITRPKCRFRPVDRETHPLLGRWRIVEMDLWDNDYRDMEEPAFIAFDAKGGGAFVFGLVSGNLQCGYSPRSIDFTWGGNDEMEEAFGYGYAELEDDGTVTGEIRFHGGDESGFKAVRW